MDVGQSSRNCLSPLQKGAHRRSSSKKGARESHPESERNNKRNFAEMRPQSKFPAKNEQDVLLRKVRSVLNKISPLNYHRLRKRWLNLMPTNLEQVAEIVQLVVAKALDDTEAQYMHIYARLMGFLVSRRGHSGTKIRSILSSQIHHELKKLTTDKEIAKFHHSMEQEWLARRRKVTLHRLIAELFVENAITSRFLMERILDVIASYSAPEEADESLECLCVVLTFAGQKLEESRKEWVDELFSKLSLNESEKLAISKRIQFMVLDLLEMRSKSWTPHGKWWVPSVRVENENHAYTSYSPSNAPELEEKSKTVNMYLDSTSTSMVTAGIATASRQRRAKTTATTTTGVKSVPSAEQQQEQTLTGILNKVTPSTLSQMADYLPQVLPRNDDLLMDITVDTILRKILSEPSYVQIYVRLISHAVDTSLEFETKVKNGIIRLVEGNLTSLEGIRILAEFYNADIIAYDEIQKTLETLLLTTGDPCLESLCNLVFLSGKKLEMELKETDVSENWMNTVMEQLEARANNCANIRLRSFILDVIDLRKNSWVPTRPLNYINPQMLDPFEKPYDIGSIITIIATHGESDVGVVRASLPSRNIAEKFVFEGLDWAIADGSVEKSKLLVTCLKIVMKEKSLSHVRPRLQLILGKFVQHTALLKGKNSDAWVTFGRIMDELHSQ